MTKRLIREKVELKIAQSKATVSGRKENSRHVQEPLRRSKMYAFIEEENKNMEGLGLSVFPMFAVIIADQRNQ